MSEEKYTAGYLHKRCELYGDYHHHVHVWVPVDEDDEPIFPAFYCNGEKIE